MPMLYFRRIRRAGHLAFLLFLCLCLAFSVSGCEKNRDARQMMNRFLSQCPMEGVLYAKSFSEGESGYMGEKTFARMYGEYPGGLLDFAVLIGSSLDTPYECAVFLCRDSTCALAVRDMCLLRLDILRRGTEGKFCLSDAFVLRHGTRVVYGVLRDNVSARRVWERIL